MLESLWVYLSTSLYFALPIYLANMSPVLAKSIPFLGQPIDAGKTFRGKPLLGKNKTWRGLIAGTIFAIIVVYLQAYFEQLRFLWLIDYTRSDIWILGLLGGVGALVGDAAKSFFKRQLSRPSGSPWPPFDQIDFILGALLFLAPWFWPGLKTAIILLLVTPILHKLTNVAAYFLKLKDVPW